MEKLEWLGYPIVKNFLKICLFVFTQLTNVTYTHTHTDTQTSHNGKNGLRHNVRHYKLYGDKMADSDSEDELRKVLSSSHGFAAECQFKAVIYRRRRTVWVRTYI